MDTTFVLGLMLVFFVLPGMVIAAGLLLILELKPGYLTRHKEKVLAVICIILAVYGASILTATQGERYWAQKGIVCKGDACDGVLTVYRGAWKGLGVKRTEQVIICRKHKDRIAEKRD